jgi:hypothetical protein
VATGVRVLSGSGAACTVVIMGADAYDVYMEEIAAVRVLIDDLDAGAGDIVAVDRSEVFRAGVWRVFAPDQNGRGYPMALVILPDPEAPEDQVLHGITSAVLQKVPLPAIAAHYREQIAPQAGTQSALARLAWAARNRLRDDLYYSIVADAYARITDAGDRRPLPTLSELSGISVGTVRTQLREARKRGLLTGSHGRAGGRLTDRGRALLERESQS